MFELKSAKLELRLDAAGTVVESMQLYVPPGSNRSVSGNDVGEPVKAYLALHRATLAGDADAMLKLVTKDRADEMRKARSEPDFPKMLEMIKAFEPALVRVVSGRADANRAELKIDGKDSDGSSMTGDVKLVREAGLWKVEKVSTKSKM